MGFADVPIHDHPIYSAVDAARYLRIPLGTLRVWLNGRSYKTKDNETKKGAQATKPLIQRPNLDYTGFPYANLIKKQLSFTNLVEAHILRVIREVHKIRLDKVRIALDYLEETLGIPHPLASAKFETDGTSLFVSEVGKLINVSENGQLVMRETLTSLLKRIEYDHDVAIRLFPNLRANEADSEKILVFDPRVSFGRLTIANTGIPTLILAERYRAGDSIDQLADDYDCERIQIEEAIRYEMSPQVA